MQTLIVPTARGWRWLAEGFALFRRNPRALALLVVLYWLLILFINVLPLVGPVIASLCIPVFSVGLMNACREVDRRDVAGNLRLEAVPLLFAAFRQNPSPLYLLGGLNLVLTLLILGISSQVDGGALMQFMNGRLRWQEAVDTPGFTAATQLSMLLLAPVIMAYWYAPVLVSWHGFSPAKALFFSFFACLRNWRAFLAYSVSLTVWGVILPGLILGVLGAVFAEPSLIVAPLAPVLLVLAPTVFASFYITYRDVFVTSEHVDVHV